MHPDPLAAATDSIRRLVNRRIRPLSWLEATFLVVDGMTNEVAAVVLDQLMAQRFLAIYDADLAQMLAQKLGRPVQWAHARLNGDGEWIEGRGHDG